MKYLRSTKDPRGNNAFLPFYLAILGIIVSTTICHSRPLKLRIHDKTAAESLVKAGGRVLADYGSYKLVEIDDSTGVSTFPEVEVSDEMDVVELNAQPLDTRETVTKALRKSVGAFSGRKLHLVQFVGPIKPEWREALEQTGVKVVHYIPQNAYLVRGNASDLAQLQNWARVSDIVQWEAPYADEYKIHPKAKARDAQGNAIVLTTDTFTVQLVDDPDANTATLAIIDRLKLAPVQQKFKTLDYLNIVVRLPADKLSEIAAQPEVISIHPHFPRHKMDERQDQIIAGNLTGTAPSGPGYLAWLAGKGFSQSQFSSSGFVVDLTDSGLDNGTLSPGHFGLYQSGDPSLSSRVAYTRLEGSPNSGSTLQGCDGHGNLNAHIIGGFNDRSSGFPHQDGAGFHYGLGVCPFVKIGSSVIFDSDNYTFPNFPNLQSRAYRDGARVSNNSWGSDNAGDYDSDSQAYDALVRDAQPSGSAVANLGNQQMVIVFAAGNAGPSTQTVGSPGTAKNVIVVGAAENVHSHAIANGGNNASGNDGCATPDSEANSANDIVSFSSRGPCADGRIKPDLVAPGSHISGGVGQSVLTTNGSGSALSCFNATGVCALPGGGSVGNANNFFPLGQQFFTTSSGTSHSTPAVAGACALLRQYFINQGWDVPSPAMTKAYLVNGTRYLNGTGAGDTLPSSSQGMGELNLGAAFDGAVRVLRDQLAADKFTASGQTRTINGIVVDSSKPFRVTLAWTDAPGSTAGNAYNNNLDLVVTVGGNTYKGNVFSGSISVTGGSADIRNNLESVILPAGLSGPFTITVTGFNINSDGVPNESPSTDQDFALVVYNGAAALAPAMLVSPANGLAISGKTGGPYAPASQNYLISNPGSSNLDWTISNSAAWLNLSATAGSLPVGGSTNIIVSVNGTADSLPAGVYAGNLGFTNLNNSFGNTNRGVTLTITNPAPTIVSNGWAIAIEGCDPANNFFDPGETVTVNLALRNVGTANTTNLVATLQAGGGVNSPSGSQDYGVLVAGGSAVSLPFSFTVSGLCGGMINASLQLQDGPTSLGSVSFSFHIGGIINGNFNGSNPATISIFDNANGFPYPSTINVSGLSANVTKVTVTLSNLSHAFPDDVDILLVGPTGRSLILMSDVGGSTSVSGVTLKFDDSALNSLPDSSALTSGTYKPTNIGFGDPFPSASTNLLGGALSVFNGQNPNGAWFLYVVDDGAQDVGTIGGWSLSMAGDIPLCCGDFVPPTISEQPVSQTVLVNAPLNLSVTAGGQVPLKYQWYFNSNAIPGATATNYSIPSAQFANSGNYFVIVTNTSGSITSSVATLTVLAGLPAVLAGWDVSAQSFFGPSPLAPTTNVANVTVAGLTRGSGVTTSGSAAAGGWGGNGFNSGSASAAVTNGDFITFGVTANSGYRVSITSINRFDYRRSGSGPTEGVLQYQMGANAFVNISANTYGAGSGGNSLGTIDLSGIAALQNVGAGTNITFRVANYNGASGGTWYIYDVANSSAPDLSIFGSVSSATTPPAAPPMLSLVSLATNQFQFVLTGTTGSNYVVEVATNIAAPTWIPVRTSTAPISFSEPATNGRRFYRGRIAP